MRNYNRENNVGANSVERAEVLSDTKSEREAENSRQCGFNYRAMPAAICVQGGGVGRAPS
jgi:hypothetical protein